MCKESLIDFSNYIIDKNGLIISKHWNREAKGSYSKGYLHVKLKTKDGKQDYFQKHRVIWLFFNGEIPENMQVNHINENKLDNRLANLNLLTPKENCNWGSRNGRMALAQSKRVIQEKPDGEIIIWQSTSECGRNGFNQGSVAAACRGEYSIHGGHYYKGSKWSYES